LHHGVRGGMLSRVQRIESCLAHLHALSPLATLRRGYSVLQRIPTGLVVRAVDEVRVGEDLQARLVDGRLLCAVKAVIRDASV
ncbi:MAG: exodeoxyribonuclease VII large subunit, partial [Geobacteraceae bacterium]